MRRLVASFVTVCLGAALVPALSGAAAHADGVKPEPVVESTGGSAAVSSARAALAGTPSAGDATLAMRDLYLARQGLAGPRLTGADRTQADALLARPSDPPRSKGDISWDPAAPRAAACGARACIQYVTTSVDAPPSEAWVQQSLATVEQTLAAEIDQLGYRAPATDGTLGGGPQFDVYLAELQSKGLYGYCSPEAPVPGQKYLAQAYCVFDNDFVGYPTDPASTLRVTAAHELFHAIQFNIDAAEDRWMLESTATWMEEQIAGDVNDNRQYLPAGQLGVPQQSLDTWGDLGAYGNWIFFQRLSQRYGVDSVRDIWNRADATVGQPDEYSVQAVKNYLKTKKTRFDAFYGGFVQANLNPRSSYKEGSAYKAAPVTAKKTLSARKRTIGKVSMRVPHLASKSLRIKGLKSLRGKQQLTVGVRAKVGRPASPYASAMVYKKSGKVSTIRIKLNKKGVGSKTLPFSRSKVRNVVVVLANASTRYRCFTGNLAYACLGTPKDDKQRFTVTARVGR